MLFESTQDLVLRGRTKITSGSSAGSFVRALRTNPDSGGFSDRLRGHARKHVGQVDVAGLSGEDRKAIRQSQPHVADGSWGSHGESAPPINFLSFTFA